MTIPSFPSLRALGWSNFKRPTHATLVSPHASGDEVRATNQAYPIYEFELTFPEALIDVRTTANPALETDLRQLMGFYLQCQGKLKTFRYMDSSDCAVVGQPLGVGDGQTTTFPFLRSLGGWVEPVSYVETVTSVYVDGVRQTAGVDTASSVTGRNLLVFNVAPTGAITADFSYSFLCSFSDDVVEFEQQIRNVWGAKSVKFKSVKRP